MSIDWTQENTNLLRKCWKRGMRPWEIAELLNTTPSAVRGRAERLGIRFDKATKRRRLAVLNRNAEGHRPFTPRCAELLREAGVKI
jgi:hypothetical protein